jgi:2-polyprenyl-6-methoxyphenol hydroxylase-like FAD-dependent oxidoreductase
VWYWNVPEGEQLRQVLTDRTGRFRDYSIPQGTIRQELVEQQRAIAVKVLPEAFLHLFEQTLDPFIQPIYDLSVPQMAFGRVCLTGDAAFVLRPHTGASTSKAATNAMELAKEVQLYKGDVVTALKKWEVTQLELGNYLKEVGISRGNLSQFAIDCKDSGDWLK